MEETSEACGGYGYKTDPAGSDYDVFLSFRGPDTRHGITDLLYESMTNWGIRVFLDNEEIHRGEEIGDELKRAIRGSRVYVVVFSRNYASSAWCLRELSMMMDCRRDLTAGKIVLPIFYNVRPCDVKLRTDLYQSALDKHKGRYGEEGVKSWEEALVKVGGISGWDYKSDQGEGKFVRLVVQDVLSKLKIRDRGLPHHLTGIDDRVDSLMDLLNCVPPEVRVVMVHGMGGIGKTTLANVIFNRICSQFDGYSFLPDVRQSSCGQGGIAKLQMKLLSDILGDPVTEEGDPSDGMNLIKRRLRGKRVLIIFDDVSERYQLDKLVGNCDFLGLGTRIIVTTRDKSVCKGLTRPCVVCTYEMKEMSDDHALRLFSRHAFGDEGPLDDFAVLSEQIVRTTGNLPLALEVIGGHLCGETKDVWENTLQDLKRVPHKDVMKILLISYEGLEEREKQIFLDIACFSNVMPRRYASYMWEARGFNPNWGVAVLLNKSLVKELNDDEFGMHDLIRDMGREIVCSEGLESLGMRSRLWDPEDARNVVREKEGTNKVLAINLGVLPNEHRLACEEFKGMSNLRFLRLIGGQFIGDFRNFLRKLMWLHWEDCERGSNPAFFNINNLVVLKISGHGITDESMKDLRMSNLRALEIRHTSMTTMPDLSRCSKLERIIIKYCFKLKTLHSSVGKLEDLTSLHIEDCESLRSLPEELGSAKALEEFSLIDCKKFEELPESIGRLGELRVLRVTSTEIRKLPASIGNLFSLEELNLERCDFRQLPGTICQLSRLRSLFLSTCRELRELPELPSSLTKLRVESCSLQLLPDLSSLTNLTELALIVDVPPLECISGDRQPLHLPWLGKLCMLQTLKLNLWGSPILLPTKLRLFGTRVLPWTELGSLSRLQELDLSSEDMSSWWQLPSSLRSLRLSEFKTDVPWEHYSNLEFLHRLELCGSTLADILLSGLDKLGSLSRLKIGSCLYLVTLSDLACLRRVISLRMSKCPRLVDISGVEKMEQLEELSIDSCNSLRRIPDLSDLTRLKNVSILSCRLLSSVPCMIGECYLVVYGCGELDSFEGPYRQYHQKRKGEEESI